VLNIVVVALSSRRSGRRVVARRMLALSHVGVLAGGGHVENTSLGSVLEYMTSFHGNEDEAVADSWGEDGVNAELEGGSAKRISATRLT
jgi:hypothetical protein